jgi:hypothetical protein
VNLEEFCRLFQGDLLAAPDGHRHSLALIIARASPRVCPEDADRRARLIDLPGLTANPNTPWVTQVARNLCSGLEEAGRSAGAPAGFERAAHYLEVAGDHAAAAFANDEAIASYRYGLSVTNRDDADAPGPDRGAMAKTAMALRIKLGEVLWRNEPDKGAAVLAGARPVVLARGDPSPKDDVPLDLCASARPRDPLPHRPVLGREQLGLRLRDNGAV